MACSDGKKRIAVAWWGCLDRGGETLGDLLSVIRFRDALENAGHEAHVFSRHAYSTPHGRRLEILDWESVPPTRIDLLAFVCGPLIFDSPAFQSLLHKFCSIRKVAVGVSVLRGTESRVAREFDYVFCRDGLQNPLGDYAFSPRLKPTGLKSAGVLGVCLRGPQREYGAENCDDQGAKRLVDACATHFNCKVVELDTRLGGNISAAGQIVRAFEQVDMVISSRLHGCLHALSLGKPFFAIDQIYNGAKVSQVLRRLEWPHLTLSSSRDSYKQLAHFLDSVLQSRMVADLRQSQRIMEQSLGALERSLQQCINVPFLSDATGNSSEYLPTS